MRYAEGRTDALTPAATEFPDGSRVAEGPLSTTPRATRIRQRGRRRRSGDNRYEGQLPLPPRPRRRRSTTAWRFQLATDEESDPVDEALGGFRCIQDLGGDDRYEAARADGAHGRRLSSARRPARRRTRATTIYEALSPSTWVAAGWASACSCRPRRRRRLRRRRDRRHGRRRRWGSACCCDEAGQDIYRAHLYAQGFAYLAGVGLLVDRAGSDLYAALPQATPTSCATRTTRSRSPRASRSAPVPRYSGGIAVLEDGEAVTTPTWPTSTARAAPTGTRFGHALRDRGGNDHY